MKWPKKAMKAKKTMKAKKAIKDKFEKVLTKHLNIVNGCCRTQIQGQT